MPHRNAPLTETGRLRLARCVVDDGWPLRRAAERFQVSPTTAKRWADRYRELRRGRHGRPLLAPAPQPAPDPDPHRAADHQGPRAAPVGAGPHRVPAAAEPGHRPPGPDPLRARPPGPPRPRHRAGDPPLRTRPPRRPGARRHQEARQHPRRRRPPGTGPPGRPQEPYRRRHTATCTTPSTTTPAWPTARSCTDEKQETAAAFWTRAQAFFAQAGITVQRVLTDNGSCYRSRLWRDALLQAGITHKRTRPYRPQTNGKVERFNRTLLDEWAYATALPNRTATTRRLPRLAPHLQSPPRTHRPQRPTTRQPRPQPHGQYT